MRTTLLRFAAVSAGAALTLAGLGLGPAPASADPSPSSTSASTWLAGELTNGVMHNNQFAFDDYGLSIDAGFAELASGNTAVATTIRDAVAAHIDDYIAGGPADPGSTYSGPVAKALVYAQASGGTPASFGGVNLVTRLESVTAASGRIADVSMFGDFANTIGQSFAARGLAAAGSTEAAAATAFLLKQQCPAGFFRLALGDAQCADNSSPDTDVTAFAVLNLQGQGQTPAVTAALDRASTWLLSTQAADGSFGGGGVTAAANTNSTGLAASALGQQCQVAAANHAATYVRGYQVPAGKTGPLSTEVGAVAYDAAAKAAGETNGITDATSDQWRRATAQGGPGLSWDATAPSTLQVSAPKGFVKGGTRATVTISGASAGERVCVTDTPGHTVALTGTGSPLTHVVDTARKGGDVTVTATTGPGTAKATVAVLGKARLKPKLAKVVHQGDRVAVKLKRLGAQEKVKVYVDGKLVDKGRANNAGVFKGHFVARLHLGTHKLKVVGQFKNRVGGVAFRVVR
jgi:hypothetical protein